MRHPCSLPRGTRSAYLITILFLFYKDSTLHWLIKISHPFNNLLLAFL